MQYKILIFILFLMLLLDNQTFAQSLESCNARLENGTLILENDIIRRSFQWNNAALTTTTVENKSANQAWKTSNESPDFTIPGMGEPNGGEFETIREEGVDGRVTPHLKAIVITKYDDFDLKRVFRIYPGCPAIACDVYLRGTAPRAWHPTTPSVNALKNYEMHGKNMVYTDGIPVMDRLNMPGRHWELNVVDFLDGTDNHNTLVNERSILAYRFPNSLKGNLLFADDKISGKGLFILKESPNSNTQLAYPGFDFFCEIGEFQTVGLGLQPDDLGLFPKEWIKAYGFVLGVTDGTELGKVSALRTYYENARPHNPDRDDMILMNTWGDRNKASKMNEQFCLDELEAGHRLGISHFQLDYGWYESGNPNSPEYYTVDTKRFPDGLQPLVDKADELGMTMGIYGNPGPDYFPYLHWKSFGNAFIDVYEETGISLIKFDLFRIADKLSDINVKRMLDHITRGTDNEAFFNIDITFQDRTGYFYGYEYGNYFLENRYTDWLNYYPHWTLRNLWMLSKYVPSYMLQSEFLNKWRNQEKYPEDDPFKPANIPFDYIFAITMAGQPLAWFEASELPEQAFEIAPLVKNYRAHQSAIHGGQVFPIGQEPSGTSWTGFQSINGSQGYLIVYREQHNEGQAWLKTWFDPGQKIKCEAIMGYGKNFTGKVNLDGELEFSLPDKNTFAVYKYSVL